METGNRALLPVVVLQGHRPYYGRNYHLSQAYGSSSEEVWRIVVWVLRSRFLTFRYPVNHRFRETPRQLGLVTVHDVPQKVGNRSFTPLIRQKMKSGEAKQFAYCSPTPGTGLIHFLNVPFWEETIFFFDVRHKPPWLTRERQAAFADPPAPLEDGSPEAPHPSFAEFFEEDWASMSRRYSQL